MGWVSWKTHKFYYQMSSDQNPCDIPLYWLVDGDPCNVLL